MLESECGTKWCPAWRSGHAFGDNRWTGTSAFPRQSFCLGPKCAWWIDTGYDDKAGVVSEAFKHGRNTNGLPLAALRKIHAIVSGGTDDAGK